MDIIDEFTYKIYGYLSSWYNPFERMERKTKQSSSIREEFNEYLLGDEKDKKYFLAKQEALIQKERQKIPEKLGRN